MTDIYFFSKINQLLNPLNSLSKELFSLSRLSSRHLRVPSHFAGDSVYPVRDAVVPRNLLFPVLRVARVRLSSSAKSLLRGACVILLGRARLLRGRLFRRMFRHLPFYRENPQRGSRVVGPGEYSLTCFSYWETPIRGAIRTKPTMNGVFPFVWVRWVPLV